MLSWSANSLRASCALPAPRSLGRSPARPHSASSSQPSAARGRDSCRRARPARPSRRSPPTEPRERERRGPGGRASAWLAPVGAPAAAPCSPEPARTGLTTGTAVFAPPHSSPLSALSAGRKSSDSTVFGGRAAVITPERDFYGRITLSGDQVRLGDVPILAAGGRALRLPRPLPDPRGDDVPDQPLAGRDARGGRGARPRVRAHVERARDPRLGRGLVGRCR